MTFSAFGGADSYIATRRSLRDSQRGVKALAQLDQLCLRPLQFRLLDCQLLLHLGFAVAERRHLRGELPDLARNSH